MTDIIRLFDKESAVAAIKKLGLDDLRFLNHLIVERIKLIHREKTSNEMAKFTIGDRVHFEDNTGGHIRGTVTRLNKKSVTVIANGGMQWNVAPRLLKVEGLA